MTDATEIRQRLLMLSGGRQALADLRTEWTRLREAFEAEHEDLRQRIATGEAMVTGWESDLRALVLTAYETTGNRTPAPGVEVKAFKTITIDPQAAMTWALEHRIALKLDEAVLKRLAEKLDIPGVTRGTEYRAQIATDLAKALQSGD